MTVNSLIVEGTPIERPNYQSLLILAIFNSICYDWLAHQKVDKNLNKFIIKAIPFPSLSKSEEIFLAHSALRLCSSCAAFLPLWLEQLGNVWREKSEKNNLPIFKTEEDKWFIRAAIDAVVAHAYGLSKVQYRYLLSRMNLKTLERTPEICLSVFQKLEETGINAFIKQYDPYWDIPLNINLPCPVLNLQNFSSVQSSINQKKLQFPSPENSYDGTKAAFDALLSLLKQAGVITSADAQSALNLSATDVRPLLRILVDRGYAEVEGRRRGTKYIYKESHKEDTK